MRKLTILAALAAVTLSSGCTRCCGRCRNWFAKGSPCGTTTVAPAMLGAPLAMGTPIAQPVMAQPMMSQPMMSAPMCVEQAPMCMPCVPCDPCADPCAGAMNMGYMGGYTSGGMCCESTGDVMTVAPGTVTLPPGTTMPPAGTVDPGPVGE
jgi:hypothetical protein